MKLPGRVLRRVADRLFAPITVSRIIDPAIADWQAEYTNALREGRIWLSRRIRWSGYGILVGTLATYGLTRTAGFFRDWPADERRALVRIVSIAGVVTVGFASLLMCQPVLDQFRIWRGNPSVLIYIYLLPQAMPIAVPIGLTFGILHGWRSRAISRRVATAVVLLTFTVSMQSLLTLDRLMPAANQAFRTNVFRRLSGQDARSEQAPLARGVGEWSFSDLRAKANVARVQGFTDRARRLVIVFHERIALGFASLPLAAFALAVVRRPRLLGHVRLAIVGCGAVAVYVALMGVGNSLARSNLLLLWLWLPHGVLLAGALVVRRRSQTRHASAT